MVSVTKYQPTEYDRSLGRTHIHREGTCLSSDTKPTTWDDGSMLLETDTSKVYIFDKAGSAWREWT